MVSTCLGPRSYSSVSRISLYSLSCLTSSEPAKKKKKKKMYRKIHIKRPPHSEPQPLKFLCRVEKNCTQNPGTSVEV